MLVARPPMRNWFGARSKRLPDVSSGAVGDEAAGCADVCGDGAAWASTISGAATVTRTMREANESRRMCCLPSPHEELARRMVRAVNVRVTVHTRSAEHAVALIGRDLVLVV